MICVFAVDGSAPPTMTVGCGWFAFAQMLCPFAVDGSAPLTMTMGIGWFALRLRSG